MLFFFLQKEKKNEYDFVCVDLNKKAVAHLYDVRRYHDQNRYSRKLTEISSRYTDLFENVSVDMPRATFFSKMAQSITIYTWLSQN